jgi:hypothetical protein
MAFLFERFRRASTSADVYLSLSELLMQPILGNSNRRSVLAYSQVSCLPFGNFLDCGGPDGSIRYERVPMAFGTGDKVNHDAKHFPGFHVEAIDGVIGSHSRDRVPEFLVQSIRHLLPFAFCLPQYIAYRNYTRELLRFRVPVEIRFSKMPKLFSRLGKCVRVSIRPAQFSKSYKREPTN